MPGSKGAGAGAAAFDPVIFDCDGVLVDSETISCRAGLAVLAEVDYRIDLIPYMDRFVGRSVKDMCAMIEAELGRPLPPDIFLHAVAQMGAAPDRCLVVEDSTHGVIAAKAAGMTAYGFTGASHCRTGHGDRLTEAGADLVFADMTGLPRLLAAPSPAQRKRTFTTS